MRRLLLLAFTVALAPAGAQTRPSDPSLLTVERIYSREFAPRFFGPTKWLDDSTYTTLEAASPNGGVALVRYDAASGRRSVLVGPEKLTPAGRSEPLDIDDYEWSHDHGKLLLFANTARVWRANTRGDYWVLDIASGRLKQVGASAKPSTLMFAKFSPDGRRVAYVREHDLYVESIADGRIVRLTHDGSKTMINGTFDWVYEEELSMRDGFRWSPDGARIAYWQLDASGVRDFLLIDNTDSLYSYTIPVQYPKAGTTNSSARIGVVSASGGSTTWIKIPGDPRNNYLARMDWAANSSQLMIQQLNRRQTQNTMFVAEAGSGNAKPLFVERDSAWIDIYDDHANWGPGPSLHWLQDGSAFVYLSERDGWRHAYLVKRDGTMKLITPGNYDVMKIVSIDLAGGWVYFDASPENATQMFLWRTKLDGSGQPARVTPVSATGNHEYDIGPNAKWAIHEWNAWGAPPTTDLVRLPSHESVRTLSDNSQLAAHLSTLKQHPVEFTQVDIGGGVKLDAWIMRPADFDSTRKYPVLFHVYGEPASQTVTDTYGGVNWLWHLMLAQQGYMVVSVDNRGTPGPRGRAWRKALHNQMGALRVREQSSAARALARARPYMDSTRFGVWGWSGGGSSTLHLMFRSPELYKVGMSVAPVADVKNYDTIYQERYVGLPSTDSLAYHDASAINWAPNLRGDLLVVHGSGDDNVHFQGTEQLINALVATNRPFQMMEYPNRSHGIFEGPGTRVHLFNLLTRYLEEHLPPGPRAIVPVQ